MPQKFEDEMAVMEEELGGEGEDSPEDGDSDPDSSQMSEQGAGSGNSGEEVSEEVRTHSTVRDLKNMLTSVCVCVCPSPGRHMLWVA